MKKNISLTYSLLLLPLIASSSLLSMEHNDEVSYDGFAFFSEESAEEVAQEPTQEIIYDGFAFFAEPTKEVAQEITIEFQPAVKEYHQITTNSEESAEEVAQEITVESAVKEYHPIATNPVDYSAFPFLEELAAELSVDSQITTEEQPNVMLQSVMLPTEEKGLGILGTISYYCKDVVTNIISYLATNTFDTNNKTHFALLHEAVQKAAANNDFDTLATIAALCQSTDDYQAKIRISDEVAQPALNVFTTKYAQEVDLSNGTIRNHHQTNLLQYNARTDAFAQKLAELVSAYNQEIKNIASHYDVSTQQEVVRITTMQQQINTFGKLNASIRPTTAQLLSAHTTEIPKNRITKKIGESEKQLEFLSKIGSNLPKIKDRTLSENLQLNTK
jgi:hypothetical protein